MFSISKNGIIELSRGDNIEIPLFINKGTPLEPIRYDLIKYPNTQIYFGLMFPGQQFENAVIKKKYTRDNINDLGDIIIKIAPEDTIYLDPGKYFYEIKAVLEDGMVNTLIQRTEFWLR